MIVKSTSTPDAWYIYHTSLGASYFMNFDTTAPTNAGSYTWATTTPTSTQFTVGVSLNSSGTTYVAYLFANNAGGFGLTGTDNVISCGSFTCDGSGNATVNLGFEPQWIIAKEITTAGYGWQITDNMRGLPVTPSQAPGLLANTSAAEVTNVLYDLVPTSTGFNCVAFSASKQVIYIAIRRGPMKVPTDATKVFSTATALSTNPAFVSNAVVDMGFNVDKSAASIFFNQSRLAGAEYLNTRSTAAGSAEASRTWDYMKGMISGQSANTNNVGYMFGRAPSFADVVCYTGTGSNTTFTHNLGVAPELLIVKNRTSAGYGWLTYSATLGATKFVQLNSTAAEGTVATYWNNTAPTSSVFSVGTAGATNASADNFVAYLFATCAGVSKVGSYTGNGTTQTIDCGFTGGARFVLIKRTDSTGDWYVYDTLRGMTVLTDPYLLMNSAAAETATLGSVTTVSTGFAVNASILAAINTNGASYIFLAIA
jgi:hypothetical protein